MGASCKACRASSEPDSELKVDDIPVKTNGSVGDNARKDSSPDAGSISDVTTTASTAPGSSPKLSGDSPESQSEKAAGQDTTAEEDTAKQSGKEDELDSQVGNDDARKEAEALASAQKLASLGEWGEAEEVLLALLDGAGQAAKEVWARIQSKPHVQDVLRRSRIFWDARQCLPQLQPDPADVQRVGSKNKAKDAEAIKEGLPGWTMLPKVRIDYYQLLPGSPKGFFDQLDPEARILWRVNGGTVQIKVLTEFPSRHPTMSKSFVLAFLSMWAEVDKWPNWNPVIPEPPRELRPPTLDQMTWEEKTSIRFIKKEMAIGEMNRLFSPDGVIVQKVEAVLNPEDDRVKSMKTSGGYSKKNTQDRTYTVAMLGADKTVVVVHYEAVVGSQLPPAMITNYVLSWVMPTLIRKMYKVGADIFQDPWYTQRHTEDKMGLYARIGKSETCAIERERKTGHKFHSSIPASRLHPEAFRSGDLFHRAQSFRND